VRTESIVYRFGPFELDPTRRTLIRGSDAVWLSDRHMDVLVLLAANAGEIVSKAALIEGARRDVAVTDNSLVQAVAGLRNVSAPARTGV
jgi:DNA-binding winged helix-turn-helix (wHTH) protein